MAIAVLTSNETGADSLTDINANFADLDTTKADLASPTFTGTVTSPAVILSSETESTIASFDATKNIKSLALATYPSLTELSYVKGVTSAIQTQISAKATTASPTFTGTVTVPTPFTIGAVSMTATGTQLNYLNAATGTTGTTSTNVVFSTSPTLVTPVLGVATATSLNGLTVTTTTGVLTLTNGKTLAVTNTLTLSGTDSTVMTFPTTTATIARTDAGQTFTGVQVMTSPSITTANLTGTQLLAEGASIGLDPSLSADGTYTGTTITGTAGAVLAFGDLIYLDPTDSRWELADANAAIGADGDARGTIGICVLAAAGDGSATTILLNGAVRADTAFPALTINAPVYAGETAGDIVVTQPTTADVVIRVLGFALTADSIIFNPSSDYITHV